MLGFCISLPSDVARWKKFEGCRAVNVGLLWGGGKDLNKI